MRALRLGAKRERSRQLRRGQRLSPQITEKFFVSFKKFFVNSCDYFRLTFIRKSGILSQKTEFYRRRQVPQGSKGDRPLR